MENILLIVICLTGLLTLALVFIFRSKSVGGTDLSPRIDEIIKSLTRVEQGLKDEFRVNREEGHKVSKDNRDELNVSLKDLKKELTDTLKTITDQNSNS